MASGTLSYGRPGKTPTVGSTSTFVPTTSPATFTTAAGTGGAPTLGRTQAGLTQGPTITTTETTTTTASPGSTSSQASDSLISGDSKTACAYSADHLSLLYAFDQLMQTTLNCMMVFNDTSTSWSQWDNPWFLNPRTYTDLQSPAWATATGTHRQLVITQNLFPSSENSADWLEEGAAGDFESYAVTLAQNLVNDGLGNSVIRLAHEANGTWYPDSIPDTTAGDAEWIQFWDNTVTAMRSVPGANFKFDWCVNVGYRNIPLVDYYPGDEYVDIIGADVYDDGTTQASNRWSHFYNETMGVRAVLQFAQAHAKPMSIPEWGINPSINTSEMGGGDDANFVQGIANLVQNNDVAYQSYFFQSTEAMQLANSPQSISVYEAAFNDGGTAWSTGNASATSMTSTPWSTPPTLTLTGGPAYASTIDTNTATYTFSAQAGYTPQCSIDGGAFASCTSSSNEVMTGLSPGYHSLTIKVQDANDQMCQVSGALIVAG